MGAAAAPGKDEASEAFPVASLLIRARLRPAVIAFYRFVRMADDIADRPDMAPDDKRRRLDALEGALLSGSPAIAEAAALARSAASTGAGIDEALAMLRAFRDDATRTVLACWDDLIATCDLSAVPAGRFLLRLHGEPGGRDEADALCRALQILNHLQDLGADQAELGRIYLPLPWVLRAGGPDLFFARDEEGAGRRRPVLDSALDLTDQLIQRAEALPRLLRDRRLAAQAAATLASARALAARLRRADPVLARPTLRRLEVAGLVVRAAGAGLLGRGGRADARITAEVVDGAGSSFRRGIASLSGERRRAMNALYAFCRVTDDAADGAAPPDERARFLDRWADELRALERGAPTTPIGRELAFACRRFALPTAELFALVEAMRGDAAEPVRLADGAALERYWRGVAGTVGLLSVRIFGAGDADPFALALARALQLVNILRDVAEDAARDRLYVPQDRLRRHGVDLDAPAERAIRAPGFAVAWSELLDEAMAAMEEAERLRRALDPRPLRPALLMLLSYRPLLDGLAARGWRPDAPRLRLDRRQKLGLAWTALRGAG